MRPRFLLFEALIFSLFCLTACGGAGGPAVTEGNNGTGDPSAGLTHEQLADNFVQQLNTTGAYNVRVAKGSTEHENFVVIQDSVTQEFIAVNLSGYKANQNAADFYKQTQIYSGLSYREASGGMGLCYCSGGGSPAGYVHEPTKFFFQKTQNSSKDLEAFAALAEEAVVHSRAPDVAARFGLSIKRSQEVVRLSMAWQKAGGKDLSPRDQDAFSKALLGFSITEAKKAAVQYLSGDESEKEKLIMMAAQTNETSSENIQQLVQEYLGIQ